MRSHHGYNYHLLLLSLLISLATFTAVQVAGSDILNQGSNITDGETLVSANGTFTLGFFAPGAPTRRYLGIWLTVTNSSDAVWVANRDHPLVDASGVLVLRDTGSLALLDGKTQTAWSSNTVGAVSPTLQLLESGNLVVRDGRSGGGILWQSFDHPTNTLVPGMKIGRNLWTDTEWYLQSWKSANDPSPGTLRYVVVTRGGGPPQIAMVDSSGATRFRTGVWNGLWFSGIPEMASYANEFAYQMTVSPGEVTYGYAARPGAPLSRLVLNDSGVVERLGWDPGSRAWNNFFQGPRDVCDKYDMCGPSGVCNASAAATSFCSCVVGFSPVSQTAWSMRGRSSGCRRNVPLDCGGDGESAGSTDWFAVLPGVKLPDMVDSWSLDTSVTLDECRARCLANCSCVAYAAADIRGGGDGTGCLMWAENLIDLRYVDGGQTLYLRQARPVSGPRKWGKMKHMAVFLAAGLILGSIALLSLVFFVVRAARIRRRNLMIRIAEAVQTANSPVDPIALDVVKTATRNFSRRNVVGEGTYGIVYEGKLPRGHPLLHGLSGRTIAVKRLKPISDLPEAIVSYFTREKQVMSGLQQHQNVIRLLAYCEEGRERILVYEYMHRRSLDAYIFGKPKDRALLNWQRRLQIIQGIAEGVKHLHEGGSAGNVIHRDLKPANVLLDGGWQAKVADFGTAKQLQLPAGATGTRTIIGTPGYMAPEYVQSDGGETTLKCDVYSFGVTLLETLGGRRNWERQSLVSEAWRLWAERSITVLLDSEVAPAPAKPELRQLGRCIHVGLLCVQEKPGNRPSMSEVVEMLSSTSTQQQLVEPRVPMVGSRILAMFLEADAADLSRPTVYETMA